MPWAKDDYKVGGVKGVIEFIGVLDEVEEGVMGKFEKLQDVYHFSAVEIVEAEEEVTLEDDELLAYVSHSRKANSMAGKLAVLWIDFCEANGLESPPESLYDVRCTYKRETFEFGPNMSPGSGFVPTALVVVEKPAKRTPAKEVAPPKLDKALIAIAKATVGEDGSTRDLLRRELTRKAGDRTKVTALGGIDSVLQTMVDQEVLCENDGVYTTEPMQY